MMTSKKSGENVLNSVEESRRDFIRKLVVGTAFAAPLMASFSMDGALVKSAEAAPIDVSNMLCSDVPSKYKASIFEGVNGVDSVIHGTVIVRFDRDCESFSIMVGVSSEKPVVNPITKIEFIFNGVDDWQLPLQRGANIFDNANLGLGPDGVGYFARDLAGLPGGAIAVEYQTDEGTVRVKALLVALNKT